MKTKVLFLCTGNSARSQMAEAFMRFYAPDEFEAFSAGFEPKGIHPMTLQVMHEIGLDLSGQLSKSVLDYLGKVHFGYVITVCAKAEEQCPIFPGLSQRIHWPFDDPAAFSGTEAARLDKFRQVRDQIDDRIRDWLDVQGLRYHRGNPRRRWGAVGQQKDTAELFEDLQDRVLGQGDLVQTMLMRSVDLLQRPDPAGQQRLAEQAQSVRQMRLAIEMRCLALIAAQRPAQGSERSPTVLIEVASDLELIGEHARQIARADYGELDRCFDDSLIGIRHLVEIVRSLLRQAMWAVALCDAAVAQSAVARAPDAGSLAEQTGRELRRLMTDAQVVDQTIHLAHAVNQLGLAAEKVVSICHWVLFETMGGAVAATIA